MMFGAPELWLVANEDGWDGMMDAGFFLDSANCSKVPRIAIFFRFLSVLAGLELDFNRCNVFPFFSVGKER